MLNNTLASILKVLDKRRFAFILMKPELIYYFGNNGADSAVM